MTVNINATDVFSVTLDQFNVSLSQMKHLIRFVFQTVTGNEIIIITVKKFVNRCENKFSPFSVHALCTSKLKHTAKGVITPITVIDS